MTLPLLRLPTAVLAAWMSITVGASAASARPAPTLAPSLSATLPPTGRLLQRFTAANQATVTMTREEARQLAKSNDVISAHPAMFAPFRAVMKAANPALVLLVYVNGTFAQSSQGSSYPASWYLHDGQGNKVRSVKFGNYAMDPTNSGWIANQASSCKSMVAASGYDGCFVDVLGTDPLTPGYLDAPPINPATGLGWTAKDWLAATANIQATIAAAVAPKPVVGNGLFTPAAFFDPTAPTSVLLGSGAGDMAEEWLRAPTAPANAFPSPGAWKQALELLAATAAAGRSGVVVVHVWAPASKAEIEKWHILSLATFLLGANGTQYLDFSSASTPAGVLADNPWDHTPIGAATGAYTVKNGIYQRAFTNGLVLVNQSGSTQKIPVGKQFHDLYGNAVTSVLLAPGQGDVLTLS